MNLHAGPDYTSEIYGNNESFCRLVERCERSLKEIQKTNPFTMLAGCGNSAAPLLGALGILTGLPIILVRKKGDRAHDSRQANGQFVDGKYLVIDDLISSGETVNHIFQSIQDTIILAHRKDSVYDTNRYSWSTTPPTPAATVATELPQCAGILLYNNKYGGGFRSRSKGRFYYPGCINDALHPVLEGPETFSDVPTFYAER